MNGHLHIAVIPFVAEEFLVKFERIPSIISVSGADYFFPFISKILLFEKVGRLE